MNAGRRLFRAVVIAMCGFALWQPVGRTDAQDWERWLRTQPYTPPQYDRTPQIFPAPPGQVFPYHQEARPTSLQRWLRQLRREQALASMTTDEAVGPSLSEISEIESQLYEAALQAELASRSLSLQISLEPPPEEDVPQPDTPLAPLPPASETSSTAPLVTQPAASSTATTVPAALPAEKPPVNIGAASFPASVPGR